MCSAWVIFLKTEHCEGVLHYILALSNKTYCLGLCFCLLKELLAEDFV
jgi:hypothetical protein